MEQLKKEGRISYKSKMLFVDDGSQDSTWKIITKAQAVNHMVAGIKLSNNEGHQKALLAGMFFAKEYADIVITLDADLQQDIERLDKFIDRYEEGYEIVYGIRNDRKTDGYLKKITAKAYYLLLKHLNSGISLENCADYRLMSKKAVEALESYPEVNVYLRGLIPLMGFNSTTVYFDVKERTGGKSKYTVNKMVNVALDGITSFSIRPIRIITMVGFLVFVSSIFMFAYIMIAWLRRITIPGWASLAVAIWMVGGIQTLALGIVGEYIAKIYLETKHRPRYHIDVIAFKE